jgi:hypothetical protein
LVLLASQAAADASAAVLAAAAAGAAGTAETSGGKPTNSLAEAIALPAKALERTPAAVLLLLLLLLQWSTEESSWNLTHNAAFTNAWELKWRSATLYDQNSSRTSLPYGSHTAVITL